LPSRQGLSKNMNTDKVRRNGYTLVRVEGMEIPWQKSEYSQETIWRRFCEAHMDKRRSECKLSVLVQKALDGTVDGGVYDVSRVCVYR
jgi:ribosomal protein S3AE